ncbi:hypothetical protein [Polaribacter sp.]|uniref:hypothetical protein n=1 Tax=Polaribacter sp. TaxID=1920175 RepID=UPI003F6B44EF
MILELINSISLDTLANYFIDYTLFTVAFFSFFTLVHNLWLAKKENKLKKKWLTY